MLFLPPEAYEQSRSAVYLSTFWSVRYFGKIYTIQFTVRIYLLYLFIVDLTLLLVSQTV
jgi:hypothetical protein